MKYLSFILLIFACFFLFYLSIPSLGYPKPPSDAVQSMEDGDNETPLRRAYFTDFSREEVLQHYQNNFKLDGFWNNLIVRLNYPPEDSQTLIRDQTRSTFLEELAYPFRESIYINGFEPKEAKDDIWYKGQHFRQKIIIRYSPSNTWVRILTGILTIASIYGILNFVLTSVKNKNE